MLRHVTVLAAVPVDPDAPTARRWLEDELANPIYHEGPSLIERFLAWITERLEAILEAGGNISPLTLVIAVAIVAALIAVAVWIAGPARLRGARLAAGAIAADDDTRSAEQMRHASDDAAARGDLTTAVVERFRAIVRSAEERVVLTELPGRTADEAASELGAAYPTLEVRVRAAARLFDDTLYGERPATAGHLAELTDLDTTLGAARAVPTAQRAVVLGRLR
ncbi:DUF4129 domain-containing protein [Sanguibacter sp. A247]|uniref:DUF4129 domain-containing protein n=1 Tax=unclassified Sanguibacter TaxID=2645534 RepID=UPI003FD77FFD